MVFTNSFSLCVPRFPSRPVRLICHVRPRSPGVPPPPFHGLPSRAGNRKREESVSEWVSKSDTPARIGEHCELVRVRRRAPFSIFPQNPPCSRGFFLGCHPPTRAAHQIVKKNDELAGSTYDNVLTYRLLYPPRPRINRERNPKGPKAGSHTPPSLLLSSRQGSGAYGLWS